MQVLVGLNCGCMVAVLPDLPVFALLVLLRGASRRLTACFER